MRRMAAVGFVLGCWALQVSAQTSRPTMSWNITDYGAVAGGTSDCTRAIQQTIDACAAAGGGTVYVPAGKFLIGAIWLRSNVTLHLEAGAVLLGSEQFSDYPLIPGRWEGTELQQHSNLINADGAERITIEGRGTIDARGKVWWDAVRSKKLDHPRGRLIGLIRCRDVRITGVTLMNSPAWTVHPVYCENVTVDGITIRNPSRSVNTDGINPDSCRNVHIANCHIDVGDDCITLKSGKDEDGRRVGKPCENITITNCTMLAGHGGVTIGSEMSGGVNNVAITNCVFDGTDNGIRMKTQRGRGGVVQNVRASNLVMRNVGRAIYITMMYHHMPAEPVSERTPRFRNIHISNITVDGAKMAGDLAGLPEMPLEDVTVVDANFDGVAAGISVSDARGIELHDVRVNTKNGPAATFKNVDALDISGVKTSSPHEGVPVLELTDVRRAVIRGCIAGPGTSDFCKITGAKSAGILLMSNAIDEAVRPFVLDETVDRKAVVVR